MKSLENERPSYFPVELWNLLGAWEKQQCVLYQRVYLGLSESTEGNPCEAEKQGSNCTKQEFLKVAEKFSGMGF